MRFVGRREGVDPELVRRWSGPSGDRRQRPDHAVRGVQLRRAGGDPRRGAALHGGDEEEFARCSTRPTCTTPTCSSARAASSASRTTCCGSAPTPSSCSATSCGRTSREAFEASLDEFARAGAGSAAADGRRGRRAAAAATRASAPRAAARTSARASLVAVPAIAVALFIVARGGWVFAAALIVLGIVCLHELFRCAPRATRSRLAGFVGAGRAAGRGAARRADAVLLAFVAPAARLPARRWLQPRARRRRRAGGHGARARAGSALALAHAVLLRDLPHGDAIVIDVLVGTFIGDTGAYLGGRAFGPRPLAPAISPNKTVEGLVIGMVAASRAVWFAGPLPGLAVAARRRCCSASRWPSPRRSATCSSRYIKRDARRRRTRARCSARTAARWTASTRCCSPRSSGTTSGTRCCSGRPGR